MDDHDKIDPWLGNGKEEDKTAASENASRVEEKPDQEQPWERDALKNLAVSTIQEHRRARRWNIFFKMLFFLYLLAIFIVYLPADWESPKGKHDKHTALVELNGVIAADKEANADSIITGLRNAFENKKSEAVILRINSPGGSPVQSGYVYDEVVRLREKYPQKKLYAVVTDICASGGYYIASSADEIFADKASIVGSIGVLMDSFGFVDAMGKLGVERRLLTAGESKGFLDPFSPLKKEDQKHVKTLLSDIHEQFISAVKKGRGDRLSDAKELFSGLIWTGEQGLALGLVDQLGSSSYVAREIVGAEDIVDYTYRVPYFERFAERIGAATAESLAAMLETKIR
ncbi:MAG: S49 family peptidase [Gammaproteobacteria bacterium]